MEAFREVKHAKVLSAVSDCKADGLAIDEHHSISLSSQTPEGEELISRIQFIANSTRDAFKFFQYIRNADGSTTEHASGEISKETRDSIFALNPQLSETSPDAFINNSAKALKRTAGIVGMANTLLSICEDTKVDEK